jgi:hypothetical protein
LIILQRPTHIFDDHPLYTTTSPFRAAAKMSDGEVEVEAPQGYPVLPKVCGIFGASTCMKHIVHQAHPDMLFF